MSVSYGSGWAAAAKKYGIPAGILEGVWGMETNFGQDVKTSSAGAVGEFQFLPSTAGSYGYPLTNTPTVAQFQQQADAAAHYLSDLYKQHGNNWDAALKAYSGGGYGLAQVQAKAKTGISGAAGATTIPTPAGVANTVGNAIDSVPKAITGAVNTVIGDAKYAGLLIVVLVVGAIMIVEGLRPGTTRQAVGRAGEMAA